MKIIVICCSGSFYKEIVPIEKSLTKLGYKVVIPSTANKMKKANNFDISLYKTWHTNPKDFHKKTKLMDEHFKKIVKGDAILVVNLNKKGMKGYIGGNTLMEMTIAYFHKKPIYILHEVSKESLVYEEIIGVTPTFLKGDLNNLVFNKTTS